jgi:hypothetical protein
VSEVKLEAFNSLGVQGVSYKQTLTYFYPRISRGGVILFDEYNDPPWPGCKIAVDEFLADKPEKPVPITMDNYQKYFIEKRG